MGLVGDPTIPLRGQATREHCSMRLLLEILSNMSTQGCTFYCTSGLWYNKTTRIPPPSWYTPLSLGSGYSS